MRFPLHLQAILLTAITGVGAVVWAGAPPKSPEYEVKAKLLRSIGSYVTWPDARARKDAPFVIGVLGDSPFEGYLDDQVQGRVIQGRKVKVSYLRALNSHTLLGCDLLFISESEYDRLPEILRICKGQAVLTVADTSGFGNRGVILNMVTLSGRIGLEINTRAAREAGLEVGSALLSSPNTRILQAP